MLKDNVIICWTKISLPEQFNSRLCADVQKICYKKQQMSICNQLEFDKSCPFTSPDGDTSDRITRKNYL